MDLNLQTTKFTSLQIKTAQQAIKEADEFLHEGATGRRPFLATRWQKVNTMLLGGFHFGQTYMLCGASGHGKSFFANMLHTDFTSNYLGNQDVKVLHFSFEMHAKDEMIRKMSQLGKVDYRKLVSSDNPLSLDELESLRSEYGKMKNENVFYVETPSNRDRIYATINDFCKEFKDSKIVISLDHTLLVAPNPGENEIQSLAELGKMFIQVRKEFQTCNILIGQMNDKMESKERRDPTNPALHYPTKTDIHGSKQIYHAADVVMVLHQPILLNIEHYGKKRFPTTDLVALHCLKNRTGTAGLVRLKNNLSHGRFDDYSSTLF
jgi:replicative DNA helicase